MLPYQPNSESCLIGCYRGEEMKPNTFHRQVIGLCDLLSFLVLCSKCSGSAVFGPAAPSSVTCGSTVYFYPPAKQVGITYCVVSGLWSLTVHFTSMDSDCVLCFDLDCESSRLTAVHHTWQLLPVA